MNYSQITDSFWLVRYVIVQAASDELQHFEQLLVQPGVVVLRIMMEHHYSTWCVGQTAAQSRLRRTVLLAD